MNKSNSASKIKMKSFDDLFGTNENLEQANAKVVKYVRYL